MGLAQPFRVIRGLWAHPIGRRRRLRTLARYVGWQTVGRLRRHHRLHPWVNGTALVLEHGMTGATGNLYVGLHEFEEMAFLLHFLRPDELFVDVGANVGAYTILASAAIGARVIAFEPVAATLAALRRNAEANGVQARVDARQVALSDRDAPLVVTSLADAANRIARPGDSEALGRQDVAGQRLDGALGGADVSLLKIDVEGHEAAVLRGASATLTEPTLGAALIEDWGAPQGAQGPTATPATVLRRHGFRSCTYDPFARRLEERRSPPADQAPQERRNSIFVRDLEAAIRRVESAPAFTVLGLRI